AIPGLGAALTACSPSGTERAVDSVPTRAGGARDSTAGALTQHNSDSRLDSIVLKDVRHGATSATPEATRGADRVAFRRYDPALPPLVSGGRLQLQWHARETPVRIREDTVVAAWTFEGDIPGPVVHCRVGDTVEFTLTNDTEIP